MANSINSRLIHLLFVLSIILIPYDTILAKGKAKEVTITGEIGITEDDGNGIATLVAIAVEDKEEGLVYYYVKNEGKGKELLHLDGKIVQVTGTVELSPKGKKWILVKSWILKHKWIEEDDEDENDNNEIEEPDSPPFDNIGINL